MLSTAAVHVLLTVGGREKKIRHRSPFNKTHLVLNASRYGKASILVGANIAIVYQRACGG